MMAQFDLYRTRKEGDVDFLLDLQEDMLESLSTRVVAPLVSLGTVGLPYVLLTHLLAAIPTTALGELAGSARMQKAEIIGALDLLFTGV